MELALIELNWRMVTPLLLGVYVCVYVCVYFMETNILTITHPIQVELNEDNIIFCMILGAGMILMRTVSFSIPILK